MILCLSEEELHDVYDGFMDASLYVEYLLLANYMHIDYAILLMGKFILHLCSRSLN